MSAINQHHFVGVEGDESCTTCLLPASDPLHRLDEDMGHMDFVREALDFDRNDRLEREAWQAHASARAERTITPPGLNGVEAE